MTNKKVEELNKKLNGLIEKYGVECVYSMIEKMMNDLDSMERAFDMADYMDDEED